MNASEAIKYHRKKGGLTQVQLGKLIGVSGATITRYERRQLIPNIETIENIANVLNISMDRFFYTDDEYLNNNNHSSGSEWNDSKALVSFVELLQYKGLDISLSLEDDELKLKVDNVQLSNSGEIGMFFTLCMDQLELLVKNIVGYTDFIKNN